MNVPLATTSVMVLEPFFDAELAALNNAITGFGKVGEENIAFKRARDSNLIQENGVPHDLESLEAALSFEINRRLEPKVEWSDSYPGERSI